MRLIRPRAAVPALATAVALSLVGAPPSHAAAGGTLVGTVTATGHVTATGVDVWVYDAAGAFVADTVTDAFGRYEVGDLSAGSYVVRFENQAEATLEWYANRPDEESATRIPVADGQTVVADAYMPISGENVVAPTVSGSATVGGTLTASPGTWFPVPSFGYAYQWLRDGVPVAGATGTAYAVTGDDVGARVSVRVTADNYGSRASVESAASAPVTGTADPALTVVSPPAVVGAVRVGATLSADPGGWTPSGVTHAYQWLRDGTVIVGATTGLYAVVPGDLGHDLAVRVTGSRSGYRSTTVTSAAVRAVAGSLGTATVAVTGTAKVGATLTAATSGWDPVPSAVAYLWEDASTGAVLQDSAAATRTLVATDAGRTIRVRATASLAGYADAVAVSAPTSVVATLPPVAVAPVNVTRPGVSGTPRVGTPLRASIGSWRGAAAYRYVWLRSGAVIAGATTSTYVPRAADAGKRISVRVTASSVAGATSVSAAAVSAPTGAVARASTGLRATAKAKGRGKVSVVVTVRSAGARGGTVTVVIADRGRTLRKRLVVRSGRATTTLRLRARGKKSIAVRYSGDGSTSAATARVRVRVR